MNRSASSTPQRSKKGGTPTRRAGAAAGGNRGAILVDDGRSALLDDVDAHSDCDSDGMPPPKNIGTFVDPASQDGVLVPPPRATNSEVKLPFSTVRNRIRYRDQFASKLFYEEWVDGIEGGDAVLDPYRQSRSGPAGAAGGGKTVRKLEHDSDFPVGKPYFWRAMCPPCNVQYAPHVPPAWTCPACNGKTWQLPEDPESKACAICRRKLAKMVSVGSHRIRNPLSLNGHNCKRCGRVVCDDCYDPNAVPLPLYGFKSGVPVRVCTQCKRDIADEFVPPPEEDDHGEDDAAAGKQDDEYVTLRGIEESMVVHSFWPPHCSVCNLFLGEPPPKWQCRMCTGPVWQPSDAPQSVECWICRTKFPKVRCHRCGQLVCDSCGAYAEPVADRGFDLGHPLTVCKSCYGGVSNAVGVIPDDILSELQAECNAHRRGAPQRATGVVACVLCSAPCAEGVRETCSVCGWICCLACSAYRQPAGGGRGGGRGGGQPVCKHCFHPRAATMPDHMSYDFWPPRCPTCLRSWVQPPERWRCPVGCGNVWQPLAHVASAACGCCGKATGNSGVNCRCCGRVVCSTCGSKQGEVPERSFTRGAKVPRCPRCTTTAGGTSGAATVAASEAPTGSAAQQSNNQKAPSPAAAAANNRQSPPRVPPRSGPPSPRNPQPSSSPRNVTPQRGRGGRGGGMGPGRGSGR